LQHAGDAFAALLAPLPAEAFAGFAQSARARVAQGRPFESVKAVYDAWIESSEAAYSRLAHTEEFASAQSRLSRAALRLRSAQVALTEGAARQLGLPTRADLDVLHHQLHELRKEIDAMRAKAPRARSPSRRKAARKRTPARRR
jgi:polyhydroxyalkanoate synthase subunit PhaE